MVIEVLAWFAASPRVFMRTFPDIEFSTATSVGGVSFVARYDQKKLLKKLLPFLLGFLQKKLHDDSAWVRFSTFPM